MDNFTDVLAMFLCLDRGSAFAVYEEFIKNTLICIPKMNEWMNDAFV